MAGLIMWPHINSFCTASSLNCLVMRKYKSLLNTRKINKVNGALCIGRREKKVLVSYIFFLDCSLAYHSMTYTGPITVLFLKARSGASFGVICFRRLMSTKEQDDVCIMINL